MKMQVLNHFFLNQMDLLKSSLGCTAHFGGHSARQWGGGLLLESFITMGQPKTMQDKDKPIQAEKTVYSAI